MSAMTPHSTAVLQIMRMLGLQTLKVRRFVLTVEVDKVAEVVVTHLPDDPPFEEVTQRFQLKEIKDADVQ